MNARLRDVDTSQPEQVKSSPSSFQHHWFCGTAAGQPPIPPGILPGAFQEQQASSCSPGQGEEQGGLRMSWTSLQVNTGAVIFPCTRRQERFLRDEHGLGRAPAVMCLHFITNTHN